MSRYIDADAAIEVADAVWCVTGDVNVAKVWDQIKDLPSAQPDDFAELKREFLRMASYIDVLLECSNEQKGTLLGFISRMSEYMPWNERD